MDENGALAAFSAISSATRLRILKILVRAGDSGMTAGQIAETVEATPSRASFHLASLAEAGLVTSSRQSRRIIYSVDFAAMGGLVRYLMEDCCNNNATVMACCTGSGKC
ncbi:MAG: metalloregulator ArsR/SmtB family transcription factor [Roseibium sp.]